MQNQGAVGPRWILSGLHIEGPEMPGTDDLVSHDIALRERTSPMGTTVVAGEYSPRRAINRHFPSLNQDLTSRPHRQLSECRDIVEFRMDHVEVTSDK